MKSKELHQQNGQFDNNDSDANLTRRHAYDISQYQKRSSSKSFQQFRRSAYKHISVMET